MKKFLSILLALTLLLGTVAAVCAEERETITWYMRGANNAYMEARTRELVGLKVLMDTPTEAFAVAELIFHGPVIEETDAPVFMLECHNQLFEGFYTGSGEYCIRFMPKESGDFTFILHSEIRELDGLTGTLRALAETPAAREAGNLTHWWSDDLSLEHS